MEKIKYGEIVYLKTDEEQEPRLVTAKMERGNFVSYELSCGIMTSWHQAIEISRDRNLLML